LIGEGFAAISLYLRSKRCDPRYEEDILSYLDRYVTIIKKPSSVFNAFVGIEQGRRHVWLGPRGLFNYLEAACFNMDYLNGLRKALPKFPDGDLRVPSEE